MDNFRLPDMRSKNYNNGLILLCFGWSVLYLALIAAPVAASDELLIRNVILVSPERDEPVHNIDILVKDGYIKEIAKNIESKTGIKVLEAGGLYLTPGLIDSHVHVYHATGLKRRYTENFDTLYDAYLDQQPRSFLYFGYTSVIELNASFKANQRFKAAPHHPRLFHCGFGWGSPPGLSGYLEMHSWAKAGILLRTIFKAATLDNAKAFGLEDQLGTIEPGKRADLLLFAENPLIDVSAYNTIRTIIVGGQLIDRQALSASGLTAQ